MHVPAVSARFDIMLEAYCRGAKILSRQQEALKKTARKERNGPLAQPKKAVKVSNF